MFVNANCRRCFVVLPVIAGLICAFAQSAQAATFPATYRFEYGNSTVFAHRVLRTVQMRRAALLSQGYKVGNIGARNIHGHIEYAFRYVRPHVGTITIRNAQEYQRARLALLALKGRYTYVNVWRIR